MYQSLVGMPKELKFDIISLFHVFEHVSTPLEQLRLLRERLNENGKIIKYPILSYIADIRHFEKVYRNILQNMKEFFKKNPEALK